MKNRKNLHLSLALLVALAGCGDDDDDRTDTDAFVPTGDMGGTDMGAEDTTAPEVTSTDPRDGDDDAATSLTALVRFSEPMDTAVGTVTVTADGAAVTPDSTTFASGDRTLEIALSDLPVEVDVVVTIGDDFADPAGNTIAAAETFTFTTADTIPPTVASSSPGEGDATVDSGITEITVTFSEVMNATAGSASLSGGPGTLGAPSWDGAAVTFPVSGLAFDTDYDLSLVGYEDAAGNVYDETVTIGDGVLDFSTGADATAPVVIDSTPSEGAVDVPALTTTIVPVVFSEAMDTSVGTAEISDGTTTAAVPISWDAGGTRALLDVGTLALDVTYSITLTGFTDVAGNALDGTTYLVDGALDFTTGADGLVPYVFFTSPDEGATAVDYRTSEILVIFSEAMDTTTTEVVLDDGIDPITLDGTWSASGATLTIDVTGLLIAGRTYAVDLSAFADVSGATLDTGHPYLADGVLDFTMATPTGENCQDGLTIAEATLTDSTYEWTLADDGVSNVDGSAPCDGSTSADGLIRYTKTGADTVLRVEALSTDGDDLTVDVYRDSCDPTAVDAASAQVTCPVAKPSWDLYLDQPAGEYFIWVAEAAGSFNGATVRVTEVAMAPEAETCGSAADSSSTYYSSASGTETWTIPMDAVVSYDRAVTAGAPGSFSCDELSSHGADAVVAFTKSSATSVLDVTVTSDSNAVVVEALTGSCDATGTSVGCEDGTTNRRFNIEADAGTVFFHIAADEGDEAFPMVTLSVTEVEPGAGDTCATAIPLTVGGPQAVTPSGANQFFPPSCAGTSNLTWYSYTASQNLNFVVANNPAIVGVVSQSSGDEVACSGDATGGGTAVFVTAGETYCLAVESGATISSLEVVEAPYNGVTGNTVTDTMLSPATGEDFDSENWLVATPTSLVLSTSFDGDFHIMPKVGPAAASFRDGENNEEGETGLAIGEEIWSVDDTTSGNDRLIRLYDSTGAYTPTFWDTGSTYVGDNIDAMAYDGTHIFMVTEGNDTIPPTFYQADPTTPGASVQIGTNDTLRDISEMEVDATYFYFTASVGGVEGIYRLARADVGNPAAAVDTLYQGGIDYSNQNASMALDSNTDPQVMYFRGYNPPWVYAIYEPDAAARFLGTIVEIGRVNDDTAMAYDPAGPSLYISNEDGNLGDPVILRVD